MMLDVQTKGQHTDMKFLITNVGNEDMVLGYPWLATYKPKVSWRNATLGNDILPVIIQSQPPKTTTSGDADTYTQRLNPEERQHIVEELGLSSTMNSTSTQLAIAAQQYKTKTTLPPEYTKYTRLFNEEASHHFPPSHPWDHAIDFVKDTPPFLDCIYIDDIGITTCTNLQDHIAAVHDVLSVSKDHDLFFSLEKCLFHAPKMDLLGVILGRGVTRMDPVKISDIKDWPTPTKVKDICSFLGFCNFYHIFIQGFTTHAQSLNKLTCKDAPWQWTMEEDNAFKTLKHLVTSEPVLAYLDQDKPFKLEVDAPRYAIGVVLSQRKEDNKLHLVAYFSATLNEVERNYNIYGLELYTIV